MARRRDLRPEELELWHSVARTAQPLRGRDIFHVATPAPELAPVIHPARPRLPHFHIGASAAPRSTIDILPSLSARLAAAPVVMDAKTHGKMTRGKLAPEARIDLHGMTMAEAHPELIRFILNAQSAGLRLVLVITGKGKPRADHGPIPNRMGVLRHNVPIWLHQAPLGPAVLQITESHARHGGAGALYVYLRKT